MKHVVITEGLQTSRGRLVKNSVVKLVDAEADALIRLGEATLYSPPPPKPKPKPKPTAKPKADRD